MAAVGPLRSALLLLVAVPAPDVRRSAMQAVATIGSVVAQTLTALREVPGADQDPVLRTRVDDAYRAIEKAGR